MSTAPRLTSAKKDWGHDETGCTVLHIDMDAFYASLETARNPALAGKAVIIGKGRRSVVSAANYEARKYGVNSAMPTARALQLCPQGIFLPVDMPYYQMMSKRIFREVFSTITDRFEQVSVDEGYMDVAAALLAWQQPSHIGAWIRKEIEKRYGITCSVGIASNKLVAKMASTNAKPNGMLLVPVSRQTQFVQMLPLRAIPGIGPSLEKKLVSWGVHTVANLADMSETALAQASGSIIIAHDLFQASHGIDPRPVVSHTPEKSIGSENTFVDDTRDMQRVCAQLHQCCNKIATRLRAKNLMTKTVTVKLRFADLSYSTKAHTLDSPVDSASVIYPHAVTLLKTMLNMPAEAGDTTEMPRDIRLAGVSASNLSKASDTVTQPCLDDLLEESNSAAGITKTARLRNAEEALDKMRQRYGKDVASLGIQELHL